MKNHLKRIASPPTWALNRKRHVFIVKPNPGAHALRAGLSLGVLLRDLLGVASTLAEAKKILNLREILVDGIRRKDFRFVVGLFDVVTMKDTDRTYRMVLDQKGRIAVQQISGVERTLKPCKITGKIVLPKGKIQFNLHDGKNFIATKQAKVGDTLMVSLPQLEIKEILPLKPGMTVFLTKGMHSGKVGVLKEIKGTEATYLLGQKEVGTTKSYLFVVGEKKPIVTVSV